MNPRLRQQVRERAQRRCEYCRLPEDVAELNFQVDHAVAEKHGGRGALENLCWACFRCNSHKGPNLAGVDRTTGKIAPLFNPRTQVWAEHFKWRGALLTGRTPCGRATVEVLCINRADALLLRRSLQAEGIRF